MDSAIFGVGIKNKEEEFFEAKDSNSEQCIRSSEGMRKSPVSFGKKLGMLSDSFVKSLANLACKKNFSKIIIIL